MGGTYLYEVKLIGFDEDRIGELKSYVDSLNHHWGRAQLQAAFDEVEDGGGVVIYQTNDRRDVDRVIGTLKIRGAVVELKNRG